MSRLLLDTHVFIFAASAPEQLSEQVRHLLTTPENELLFSAASVWEMAIKSSLGKLHLGLPLPRLLQDESRRLHLTPLPIDSTAALAVEHLPFHHRDPFDRLLIAQAQTLGIPLLSRDRALDRYQVQRIW